VLVDRETWPIRRDLDEEFLRLVEPFAQPEHFALLRSEVERGVRRVHPDEVVGACACENPAAFAEVRRVADDVVAKLDGHEPR
jgi:hypothetical protein